MKLVLPVIYAVRMLIMVSTIEQVSVPFAKQRQQRDRQALRSPRQGR